MSKDPKPSLSSKIELDTTPGDRPIPKSLADHLEVFIEDLPIDPLPPINLLNPEDARKALATASDLLKVLQGKMKQAQALKTALHSHTRDDTEFN